MSLLLVLLLLFVVEVVERVVVVVVLPSFVVVMLVVEDTDFEPHGLVVVVSVFEETDYDLLVTFVDEKDHLVPISSGGPSLNPKDATNFLNDLYCFGNERRDLKVEY